VRFTPLALAALMLPFVVTAQAAAAPVLVVDGPRATIREDPYLPGPAGLGAAPERVAGAASAGRLALTLGAPPSAIHKASAAQASGAPASNGRAARFAAAKPKPKKKRTFKGELRKYLSAGRIDQPTYDGARRAYDRARRALRALSGLRARELGATLSTLDWMVGDRRLSPTRIPALTLTLVRNRELWANAQTLPAPRGRVEFAGSEIVFEYYAGQGLNIQPLGTFGKANGLWTAGDQNERLRRLFDEMVPLMARRGNALAWEYYFFFGGGRPPWVSGMAQATGVQALSRAITRLGEDRWRPVVPPALTLFELPSPTGVRVQTPAGNHYLQYSFSPGTRIINAFLQSVIGLYEAGEQLADPRARRLAELGDAQARAELPLYDTGAWGLYSMGGAEADLDYFRLARSFLKRLCDRVRATEYCNTYQAWSDDLRNPPETRLLTTKATAKSATPLRFRLDKVSHVRVAVDGPTGKDVFFVEGDFARGTRFVTWTPATAGLHEVRIEATDLAGNKKETSATVDVAPAPPKEDDEG